MWHLKHQIHLYLCPAEPEHGLLELCVLEEGWEMLDLT